MNKRSSSVPQHSNEIETPRKDEASDRVCLLTVRHAMDFRFGSRRLDPSLVDIRRVAANMAISGD